MHRWWINMLFSIRFLLQLQFGDIGSILAPILPGTYWRMPFIHKEVLECMICLMISVKLDNLVSTQ